MRIRANHTQGRLARGGHLTVTPELLIFEPHGLDRRLGGATFQLAADEVADIGVAPRTLKDSLSGGLRRRLRITTTGGSVHLFVVPDVEQVVAGINGLLRQR